MTEKDDDKIDKFNEDPEDNVFNEQYTLWKEERKSNFGTGKPKLSDIIPLSRFGIGLLVLLVLLILLFARNRITVLENRITALEKSVQELEGMVDKLNVIDNRLTQVLEQTQSYQRFKERFDRSESALTSRMDQIVRNLGSLQKQMSKVETQKAKPSKKIRAPQKTSENRFHIVKPGETLYQIGPMYGLTVDKLRQLNKLSDTDTIYPGQKLMVNP
jgi:LysM repeat protein